MKLLDETIEIAINSIPYRSVCMIFTPRKNFEIAFEKKIEHMVPSLVKQF